MDNRNRSEDIREIYNTIIQKIESVQNYITNLNNTKIPETIKHDAIHIISDYIFWYWVADILNTSRIRAQGDVIGALQHIYFSNVKGNKPYRDAYGDGDHDKYEEVKKYYNISANKEELGAFWRCLLEYGSPTTIEDFQLILKNFNDKIISSVEENIIKWEKMENISSHNADIRQKEIKKISNMYNSLLRKIDVINDFYDQNE